MLTNTDLEKISLIVKTEVKSGLKPVKTQMNKIQKTLDATIRVFDHLLIDHDKRITKIEKSIYQETVI